MTPFCNSFKRVAAVAVLAAFPFACNALAAPAPTPVEAAGRLRSLAQRQAKLYLQVRLGVEREASERWLAEAVRAFDENLAVVERAASDDPAARRVMRRLVPQWEGFRRTVSAPVDEVRARSIAADAEQIALAAQNLAVRFDLAQDSPYWRLADLASRNDMLAQRLARIYMQIRAGQGGQAAQVDLEQTRKEFAAGLQELASAGKAAPATRSAVELARQQWLFFEMAVNDRDKSFEFARRDVATTSERISQLMGEAGQFYASQARPTEAVQQLARRR